MLANALALCSANALAPLIISVNPGTPFSSRPDTWPLILSNKLPDSAKSRPSNAKSLNMSVSIKPDNPSGKSPKTSPTRSPHISNASIDRSPKVSPRPPSTSSMDPKSNSDRLSSRSVLIPNSPNDPTSNPPRSKPSNPGTRPPPPKRPALAILLTTLRTLQDIIDIYRKKRWVIRPPLRRNYLF